MAVTSNVLKRVRELAVRKAEAQVRLAVGDPPDYADLHQRLAEQMLRVQVPQPAPPLVFHKPLNEIDNATLVMEMIKRGFAVMKLPKDGGPPEALRGRTPDT